MELSSTRPQPTANSASIENAPSSTKTADKERSPETEAPSSNTSQAKASLESGNTTTKSLSAERSDSTESSTLDQLKELIEKLQQQIQQVQAQLAQAQARAKAGTSAQSLVDSLNSSLASLQGALVTAYANYLKALEQQAESGEGGGAQLVNTSA